MNTEIPTSSTQAQAAPARLTAEPINGFAMLQSVMILGALGIAGYKVLDAALRLL